MSTLFATFLGNNPIQHLLGSNGTLSHLTTAQRDALTGHTFFPRLVLGPFHHGLAIVFTVAAAMALIAVLASPLRGGHRPATASHPVRPPRQTRTRRNTAMAQRALLVMDVQRGIVDRFGDDPGYLPRLQQAIDCAHTAGIPVIYVVIGFRPGHPEISLRNKAFARIASGSAGGFAVGDPAADVHPDGAPGPDDLVVTKKRVSAFAGSDLEMVLRAADVDSLVLTGIATSGVGLSTLRQAADLDFVLTVLEDACLDSDPEVHSVLTHKVFPRQADVVTVDEWIKNLGE